MNIYTQNEAYAIADTIWQQLGGQRFQVITGTKPVCYGEKNGKVYLLMTVGRNAKGINRFEVAYNEGQDLYEVRFIRKRGDEASVIASFNEVYCDMLTTLFESYTGLTTRFPKIAC